MGLDVWEHISPSLESAGVIKYKFWKALEMTFHLVYSHFSVLNRWGLIRILVKISEARIRYRNFSRIFACNFFSTGLSILILKTSRNSRCWVKWAFRLILGCFITVHGQAFRCFSWNPGHENWEKSWNPGQNFSLMLSVSWIPRQCLSWIPRQYCCYNDTFAAALWSVRWIE